MSTYFISAIDTDAGKTIVTGLLAKNLLTKKESVITMKIAQTGCDQYSEDIEVHREIMGLPMLPIDKEGTTCPYVFKFAASPHLAANMEDRNINSDVIYNSVRKLVASYDTVLVEGVGGLMVPVNEDLLLVDFVKYLNVPVVLVTSGKLGSINHTLLSMDVLFNRDIKLYGVVYNHYPMTEPEITQDSAEYIKKYMKNYFPDALWAEVPFIENAEDIVLNLNDEWFS